MEYPYTEGYCPKCGQQKLKRVIPCIYKCDNEKCPIFGQTIKIQPLED